MGVVRSAVHGVVLLFLLTAVHGVVYPNPDSKIFSPVTKLSQLNPGSPYDLTMPSVNSTFLSGKRVAMIASHGVEDVELYFQHAYFLDRGATVDLIAPDWVVKQGAIVLMDFTKPTYVSKAALTSFTDFDPSKYDVVYVPGGAPSSYAVRGDVGPNPGFGVPPLTAKLLQFSETGGSSKLLAFICSGATVAIPIGFVHDQRVTGSPASRDVLELAHGFYQDLPVLDRRSEHGRRPNVLFGRGPTDSFTYVSTIAQIFGVSETAKGGKASPPSAAYTAIKDDLSNMPAMVGFNMSQIVPTKKVYSGKRVAVLASHGVESSQVSYMFTHLTDRGASVAIVCPSWCVKTGVYLHDGARPTFIAKCDGYDAGELFDAVFIPGGFWSSSVLRHNEPNAAKFVFNHWQAGKMVAALDSGVEVLIPTGLSTGLQITTHPFSADNMILAGAHLHAGQTAVVDFTKKIVTGRSWVKDTGHSENDNGHIDFMLAADSVFANPPVPPHCPSCNEICKSASPAVLILVFGVIIVLLLVGLVFLWKKYNSIVRQEPLLSNEKF